AIHRPCAFVTFDGDAIPSALATGPGITDRAQPMIFDLIQPPIPRMPAQSPCTTLRPFCVSRLDREPIPREIRPGSPVTHVTSAIARCTAALRMALKCRVAAPASCEPSAEIAPSSRPGRPASQSVNSVIFLTAQSFAWPKNVETFPGIWPSSEERRVGKEGREE